MPLNKPPSKPQSKPVETPEQLCDRKMKEFTEDLPELKRIMKKIGNKKTGELGEYYDESDGEYSDIQILYYWIKTGGYEIRLGYDVHTPRAATLAVIKSGTLLQLSTRGYQPEILSMTLYKLDAKGVITNPDEKPVAVCQESLLRGASNPNHNVALLFEKADKFRGLIKAAYARRKKPAPPRSEASKVKEIKKF